MLGVYNSKVADAKVEFTAASWKLNSRNALPSAEDGTAHDLYLELPLKGKDGTVKFDGTFVRVRTFDLPGVVV